MKKTTRIFSVGLAWVVVFSLLAMRWGQARGQEAQDLADPGPYTVGWRDVTVSKPGSTITATLYYPASGAGGSNAALDDSGAPYPAISFAHGAFSSVSYYDSTLRHLASYGYLVIATRSYESSFSPDHQEYARDVSYCLDYLVAQNASSGSWLYQKVKTDAFGLSGHSMGGEASILAGSQDTRIKAIANMAADATTTPSVIDAIGEIRIPIRLIAGSEDNMTPVAANQQVLYNAAEAPRQLPIIQGGCHCGFTDPGQTAQFCNLFEGNTCTITSATQLRITRRLLTEFFNLYLKHDDSLWRPVWGPDLTVDPQVEVQYDPGIGMAPALQQANSHLVASYVVRVTNQGPLSNRFEMIAEDNRWEVTFYPAVTSQLSSGSSTDVQVKVWLSNQGPNVDTALITARSQRDGHTRSFVRIETTRLPSSDQYLPLIFR